ncbi:MAG: hypothetical protein ACUVWP_08555 [bacterium]
MSYNRLYFYLFILLIFFLIPNFIYASTAEQGFYDKYKFERILADIENIKVSVEKIKLEIAEVKDGFRATLDFYGFAERYGERLAHILDLAVNESDLLGLIKDAITIYQLYREMRSEIKEEDIAKIKNMYENIKTLPNDLNSIIANIDNILRDIKSMRKEIDIGLKLHPDNIDLKEKLTKIDEAEVDLKEIKGSVKKGSS